MLKASALYLVIIISLVIAVLCSSLIVTAYFYRAEYQKKFRYDQLQNNLGSAINILLTSRDPVFKQEKTFSLFNQDNDSISLQKTNWGIFDIGVAKAFIQKDTLYKVFTIANTIDSSKWAALYLMDEDRPLSISGKTTINGTCYLPKAGVKAVYVDGKYFEGNDQNLINGTIRNSKKQLPELFSKRLSKLLFSFKNGDGYNEDGVNADSLQRSFLQPTLYLNFKKNVATLKDIKLSGNIVLRSDTTIILDSTVVLNHVLVFAKSISVGDGFQGNCQLFAKDSIEIGRNCRLNYPSALGVLRPDSGLDQVQPTIQLGENTVFNGLVFTSVNQGKAVQATIKLKNKAFIFGQVYTAGNLFLNEHSKIQGSAFTGRFLFQNSYSLYENYIVNSTIDSKSISSYYLTSDLMPV